MNYYTEHSGLIMKSWDSADSTYFEGWLSTPARDMERDVTEPEAFIEPAASYFSRRAPFSVEHGTQYIPAGHIQKAAIVRDGAILKFFNHPTDPADFEYFPANGSGVWVRGVANEPHGRDALRKGNVGGMSFIASAKEKEPLPGGRWRYKNFSTWVESTIAAYPINPQAVIAVVKARGYEIPQEEPPTMTQADIEALVQKALADREEAQRQAEEAKANAPITRTELGAALLDFKTSLLDEVKKAMPVVASEPRNEGVGRKGVVSGAQMDERDADPVAYLVKKAASPNPEWDTQDQALIAALTKQELLRGLKDE